MLAYLLSTKKLGHLTSFVCTFSLSFSFHLNPDFYPSQYWREDSKALVLLNVGVSNAEEFGETFDT